MKRLYFMVLTTCLGWHTLYGQTAARPRPNAELVRQYELGDRKAKLDVLQRLLRAKTPTAHVTFYALLDQAPDSEIISIFATALALSGSCQMLLDVIEYLDFMLAPYQAEANKIVGPNPDVKNFTPAQKATLDSVQKRANESLDRFVQFCLGQLGEDFSNLTRNNTECLVIGLKKIFKDEEKGSDMNVLLIAGFLMIQKEDGFEALMHQIQTEDEQTLAYMVMQRFPQYAVVPSLKLIENPATPSAIRNAARIIIMGLPDNELVFQMVAEAYRHGRYFPAQQKRIDTVKQGISQVELWWGNLIKSKYQNNAHFANYLGQNALDLAQGQDQIIELLTGIDFKTGLPYLKKLPYHSLSESAKQWLLHATRPPSSEILGPALLTERYQLFAFLFEQIPPRERVEREFIYTLGEFQENVQERFILDKFLSLTDHEKQAAIYLCGKLSPTTRDRIFQQLRPKSNEELRRMMDYYSKK